MKNHTKQMKRLKARKALESKDISDPKGRKQPGSMNKHKSTSIKGMK